MVTFTISFLCYFATSSDEIITVSLYFYRKINRLGPSFFSRRETISLSNMNEYKTCCPFTTTNSFLDSLLLLRFNVQKKFQFNMKCALLLCNADLNLEIFDRYFCNFSNSTDIKLEDTFISFAFHLCFRFISSLGRQSNQRVSLNSHF